MRLQYIYTIENVTDIYNDFTDINQDIRASHIQFSTICTHITITWNAPRMANKKCLKFLTYQVKYRFWSISQTISFIAACNNITKKRCTIELPNDLNSPTFYYQVITLVKNRPIGLPSRGVLLPYRNCKNHSCLIFKCIF